MNSNSINYYERARNFSKVNPGMAVGVHTTPDAADAERENRIKIDWFTYFVDRGLQGVLANCERILGGQGKGVTFPCDSPEMFDPSYVTPRYKWHKVEKDGGPRTREIKDLHERTVKALRAAKPKGAKQVPDANKQPPMTPEQWLNNYLENPPPIPMFSDEFRKKYMRRNGDAP